MSGGITQIGPITVTDLFEPTTIQFQGPPDARGFVPAKITTTIDSLTTAQQLESLINNPLRRQTISGATGVLEYVSTSAPLSYRQGWFLLSTLNTTISRRQFLLSGSPSTSYVPIEIDGFYLGTSAVPIVAATHRAKTNDFSLTGTALVPALYPLTVIDVSGVTNFTRTGNTQNVSLNIATANRTVAALSASSLQTSYTDARPCLLDGNGVAWYGPRVQNITGMQSALFKVTINVGGSLECWVRTPASPSSWTDLGTLAVFESSQTAVVIIGSQLLDDRATLYLQDTTGHYYTATLRHGDYGVRIVSTAYQRTVDTAATLAAISANYYLETSAGPGGGKRYIAVVRTAVSSTPASGQVTIAADAEAFFGYEPASAATNDTAANQGKQFCYDRSALLTVE